MAWYADEGEDIGRGAWVAVVVLPPWLLIERWGKQMGLSSSELMGLGGTKKGDSFFHLSLLFHVLLSDLRPRISVLKYIKIQTSRLTSQHCSLHQQAKPDDISGIWLHPKHVEPLYPGVIRKCQNCAAVIYWSIREEAYELLLLLSCKSIAYENVDSMICMCIWIMLKRLLLWKFQRHPLTATEISKGTHVGYQHY